MKVTVDFGFVEADRDAVAKALGLDSRASRDEMAHWVRRSVESALLAMHHEQSEHYRPDAWEAYVRAHDAEQP